MLSLQLSIFSFSDPDSGFASGKTLALWLAALVVSAGTVTAQSVTSFTLVDAPSDSDLTTMFDGAVIDLDSVGTLLNVRANVSGSVGSVRFTLDGADVRTESTAPFALAGDQNGDYFEWTPTLGAHTLTATPFSGAGGGGQAGAALTIDFSVENGGGGPAPPPTGGSATISGELRKWHRVTLDFTGPSASEGGATNPFLDYRLNVQFVHTASGEKLVVPGFFAADGSASETSASSGNVWRAYFSPTRFGQWSYQASFRTGGNVAVSSSASAGQPTSFDGASGTFFVDVTNKSGRDFRARGLLEYVGRRYLQFRQTGEWFLKGGADSPENFLGYWEFDGTQDHGGLANGLINGLHRYTPHVGDWRAGDPTWKGGKGKGIIGALNYLAAQGMNSVYFLTMNVQGDGREVYPWSSYSERFRFDVSKLEQWEVVFEHMTREGLMLHVVTQETENDHLLDGGQLGTQRKLYYRELVARFGHHLALVWNLGEENTNSAAARKQFSDYFKAIDPYGHPVVVHTYPGSQESVYAPLLGHSTFDGPSLQTSPDQVHSETKKWIDRANGVGRPWVVTTDEISPASHGVVPDAQDYWHDLVRSRVLWGNLMAGGGGAEWYFGYGFSHSDMSCEDWRSRHHMWALTDFALDFFNQYLPFESMTGADHLTSLGNDYCLADPGNVYAVYLPGGASTSLDLRNIAGSFEVYWYDPRFGGDLQRGTVATVSGGGWVFLGDPPSVPHRDWVVLVTGDGSTILFQDGFESGNTSAWSG